MTGRDLAAAAIGAGLALAMAIGAVDFRLHPFGEARAQAGEIESPRQFMLAVAAALASVAVDSEKTAMKLNETGDSMGRLAERVADLEKRLAELERKR
jgi:hypothetical protein